MADEPKRIWAKSQRGFEGMAGTWLDESDGPDMVEYVRADLTPPASVVEAMERALRGFAAWDHCHPGNINLERAHADVVAALADLDKWRAGK